MTTKNNEDTRVVRLLTCNTAFEANLIKGRLENEGIEGFLINENITTLMPHLNPISGSGVQLMVFQKDLEKAREILSVDE